jgi:hypothetical protein
MTYDPRRDSPASLQGTESFSLAGLLPGAGRGPPRRE